MFCPQCGQRQASDESRFCSSCGFALNVVTELLANGGQLPWRPAAQGGGELSPRQKGIRQGAMLMLSTILIVPLLAILGVAMLGLPGEFVAIAAIGLPVGGFLRMLYAFLLESNAASGVGSSQAAYTPPPVIPDYLGTPASAPTLPPQRSAPIPAPRSQRFDTGEIAAPRASVTDHTTRLLDKQPDDPPKQ
ncbi:MAG TPA: zinc ribbon domain-containing protein [Pyrinomonadaceae bacterium]|nr:zinc ribbon domain-containing protein [Pyrinomonadaceae bacterium]